jgi:hypothetical protein
VLAVEELFLLGSEGLGGGDFGEGGAFLEEGYGGLETCGEVVRREKCYPIYISISYTNKGKSGPNLSR